MTETQIVVLAIVVFIIIVCTVIKFSIMSDRIEEIEDTLGMKTWHEQQLSPLHIPHTYFYSEFVNFVLEELGYEYKEETSKAGYVKIKGEK